MPSLIVEQEAVAILTRANLPAEVGGGPNSFQELALYMVSALGNWESEGAPGRSRSEFARQVANESGAELPAATVFRSPEFSAEELPIPLIQQAFSVFAVLGKYFELVQYPAFVSLQKSQIADLVPPYLPNSSEAMEDTPPRVRSWGQWRDATHEHRETDDAYLVPLNSFTASQEISGSMLVRLLADGYDVQPMHNWPPHPVDEELI